MSVLFQSKYSIRKIKGYLAGRVSCGGNPEQQLSLFLFGDHRTQPLTLLHSTYLNPSTSGHFQPVYVTFLLL